ncbi:MAG: hypothetical protein HXL12_03675, partial [Candidatus Nanosynbacter sp.]|nr:hypothetical protein [Candidatus Nanosynbacter sp.]
YWDKLIGNEDHNILWNIPTQKSGRLSIFGGNSENFLSEIRTTEFLEKLPLKTLKLFLPDALQNKLPVINYIDFSNPPLPDHSIVTKNLPKVFSLPIRFFYPVIFLKTLPLPSPLMKR